MNWFKEYWAKLDMEQKGFIIVTAAAVFILAFVLGVILG